MRNTSPSCEEDNKRQLSGRIPRKYENKKIYPALLMYEHEYMCLNVHECPFWVLSLFSTFN